MSAIPLKANWEGLCRAGRLALSAHFHTMGPRPAPSPGSLPHSPCLYLSLYSILWLLSVVYLATMAINNKLIYPDGRQMAQNKADLYCKEMKGLKGKKVPIGSAAFKPNERTTAKLGA